MNFPNVIWILKICSIFSAKLQGPCRSPTTPSTYPGWMETLRPPLWDSALRCGALLVGWSDTVGFTVAGLTPRGFEPSFSLRWFKVAPPWEIHGWNFLLGLLGEVWSKSYPLYNSVSKLLSWQKERDIQLSAMCFFWGGKCSVYKTEYHGNPQPSFWGVISHITRS